MVPRKRLSGYGLFVFETHHEKLAEGTRVNLRRLFRILLPKWRSFPEEVKKNYKYRAKVVGYNHQNDNSVEDYSLATQESISDEDTKRQTEFITISELEEKLCEKCKQSVGIMSKTNSMKE